MIRRWTNPPVEKQEPGPKGFDDFDLRIGDVMRGERATMGKSLLDVQRELKIKANFIAAIENADASAFETPGFIAGFVRSYARYLGLDPDWAFRKFCEEANFNTAHGMSPAASVMKPKPAAAPAKTAPRDPFADPTTPFARKSESIFSRIEPGAIGSIAVLAALIGVIGYGGWSVLQEIQRVEFAPVDQAPGVVAEIDSFGGDPAEIQEVAEAGVATPSPDVLGRLYRPEALEVPVLTARDGPIAALDPNAVGALADGARRTPVALAEAEVVADAPGADPQPARTATELALAEALGVTPEVQVVRDDVPEVILFAVSPSWVRVRGADGTTLFEKILDRGESYVVPKTEVAPTLHAGNAGAIFFTLNGEPYGPAGDGPSVVRQVALGSDDLRAVYSQANDLDEIDLNQIIEDAMRAQAAE